MVGCMGDFYNFLVLIWCMSNSIKSGSWICLIAKIFRQCTFVYSKCIALFVGHLAIYMNSYLYTNYRVKYFIATWGTNASFCRCHGNCCWYLVKRLEKNCCPSPFFEKWNTYKSLFLQQHSYSTMISFWMCTHDMNQIVAFL